jgi:hypothetical protein
MCDQNYSTVKALLITLHDYFRSCNGQLEQRYAQEIDVLLKQHVSQEPTPEQLAWACKVIDQNYKPTTDASEGVF